MSGSRKKPVSISSLAMRFYAADGWTKECLEPYAKGPLVEFDSHDYRLQYWIPAAHTRMDVERLYTEQVSEVRGYDRWESSAA